MFSDVAAESGRANPIKFANLRETAGWSTEAGQAGPKMAALLAAAAEPMPPVPSVKLESGGVILICGRNERAVEAGNLLKEHLDVTVLIEPPATIVPPRTADFPVAKGKVRNAKGHLGAFEVTVDDFALAAPSSRGALAFDPSRNNTTSNCDIILDLTGGTAFFPAADLRDGYVRADPGDPAAVLRAVLKARDLVGSFEKPRYVAYDSSLCAHSRSQIVRLHALPRPLPDVRHNACGRFCRHRREYLRRLWPMRVCLSDRGRVLCSASGRCADAQAARDAGGLPPGRRRTADPFGARRGPRRSADRCAGAVRRRIAGACAAVRGQ